MKIKRAVKCANIANQINAALKIADEADIKGLEIQELLSLMEAQPDHKDRGNVVLESCKGFPISALVYHFPMHFSLPSLSEAKKYDLSSEEGQPIMDLTQSTIQEAAYVGSRLGLEETLVDVHLLGFIESKNISWVERNRRLETGERNLSILKEIADDSSSKTGHRVTIVRENNPPEVNPPEYCKLEGILDFDPREIARTANIGIGTNLDFAHLWQYLTYRRRGNGEFPGVDLTKSKYPVELRLGTFIKILASSLRLIHMNDAIGYESKDEGLEIGKGYIPHKDIVGFIVNSVEKPIIGTYEIIGGHIEPERILRSDKRYRRIFRNKFHEFFE